MLGNSKNNDSLADFFIFDKVFFVLDRIESYTVLQIKILYYIIFTVFPV
jgi:hypothetical protein